MSVWAKNVELREENGKFRAFRAKGGSEITIPSFPKADVNIYEWMKYISLDGLEAFRQVVWDMWTWESGTEEHALLAITVGREIDARLSNRLGPLQQQRGNTTLSLEHVLQMQDRRNG